MRSKAEILSIIENLETDLRAAREELNAVLIAEHPHKEGNIINTKKGEAKIVRIEVDYGMARSIAVYRKKDGSWGERQRRIYSWDVAGA